MWLMNKSHKKSTHIALAGYWMRRKDCMTQMSTGSACDISYVAEQKEPLFHHMNTLTSIFKI